MRLSSAVLCLTAAVSATASFTCISMAQPAASPGAATAAAQPAAATGTGILLKSDLPSGRELRYTIVQDQTATMVYIPNTDLAPTQRTVHQEVGVVLKVTAVTPEASTVEMRFESYKMRLDASGEAFEVDMAQPEPSGSVPARLNTYKAVKPLMSAVMKLTVSPTGLLLKAEGGEELMKAGAPRMTRRFIEEDGIRFLVGPLLALRPDGAPSQVDSTWTLDEVILADRGREKMVETRKLAKIDGAIASVVGQVRKDGPKGNMAPGSVFLKGVDIDTRYTFDTSLKAATGFTRDDSITLVSLLPDSSREERGTVTHTVVTLKK